MYYAFPSSTSFQTFVQKVKQLPQTYLFVMFTFSGSYASMITKQRYLHTRLHEQMPLLVIDVRQCHQLYHHVEQLFPKLFLQKKMPLHVCFKKIDNVPPLGLQLQPVMRNAATMGDRHFEQLRSLITQDQLEKQERVTTS